MGLGVIGAGHCNISFVEVSAAVQA